MSILSLWGGWMGEVVQRMRSSSNQPPGVGAASSNCWPGVVQYTPLKGVGGVAGLIFTPRVTLASATLGSKPAFSPPLGFCIYFVHPCRHQQRPCSDDSPPAESGILTVGTMRQALFWAPSHLPGDDNFWFSGKCVVSSPNIL